MSDLLQKARDFEAKASEKITAEERPAFHLTPRCGWMNDPNGFSYFGGKYHLFYQYNPYHIHWDSMHWGHAVSSDLLRWEYLPASLAPDMPYDCNGCFSGSAIELESGKQLLIYTGVRHEKIDGKIRDVQVQCLATGDGKNYQKYEKNPVITSEMLPQGASRADFRDPKIWRLSDGRFCCAVASRPADGSGQILLYTSENGYDWTFWTLLDANKNRFGKMWECPDFFPLDGKYLLLVSPQDMLCEGEYTGGNGTLCVIGDFDEKTGKFTETSCQTIDSGIDFYAPQTVLSPDGRRIMIGWMQNWDSCSIREEGSPWAGQMSVPRELFLKNGRMCQRPSREFDALLKESLSFKDVPLSKNALRLEGVQGRILDLELTLRPDPDCYSSSLRLAEGGGLYTELLYRVHEHSLTIDRRHSGVRRAIRNVQDCQILNDSVELSLHLVLDKNSVEVFINGGEQAMTAAIFTPQAADGISFFADGKAKMDVRKSSIVLKV